MGTPGAPCQDGAGSQRIPWSRAETAGASARSKRRSLWPKEHGAYGQLGLPLVAGLAMGRPSLVSLLLMLGAAAAFVGHESVLIVLGMRGARARRDEGGRAARVAIGCAAAAVGLGAAGLFLGGSAVRWAALLPLAAVIALAPFVIGGAEKTAAGELVASAALSAAAVPVAVAGGRSLGEAAAAWGAWLIAFGVSTAAVRWVIARHKRGRGEPGYVIVAALSTLGALALALFSWLALAALPMLLAGWALIARPPHPRHLRRVGWTLVACSTATAALLTVLARVDLV